jgi:hypothetical protein
MSTVVLKEFLNVEDGVKATIAPYYKGGFSVVLWDTDANEALPYALVVNDFESAILKAKKWANIL